MRQTSASDAIRAALKGFDPSDEQWDAIRAPLEPIAVVAGAGSGKTAVMAARIIHLVEHEDVRPTGVLGLTFTNKAAGELEERLADALAQVHPHPREHPTVSTYNAFANQLLRQNGPRIGVDPESGLLSQAQKWQMLLGLVDEFPSFEELELRHPLSFIPQTLGLADQCANHLVSPDALEAECARLEGELDDDYAQKAARKRQDFAQIISRYIDAKRRRRRIDFGDQISLAVEILERFDEVVADLRERFPVVLLDEYQDTNPAQKVMLQRICPPGSAVTAVGDARQTIYAWRGASMFNLINFNREFPHADGSPSRQISLSQNFRSGRRIVELANRVISTVPAEHRPGAELVSVPDNGEGWVGAAVFADQEQEARFIADEIERLHDEGSEWRQIAVLIRTRRYMERIIAQLEGRDIPVEIPELGGLLKIPAVVETVAWLRILADTGPTTNRWLARILMGPRFRVHYGDLAPIAKWASARNRALSAEASEALGISDPDPGEVAFSLHEALTHTDEIEGVSEEGRRRIREFLEVWSELRPLVSRPLLEFVQSIIERTGIADTLRASPSRSAPAMHENLQSFLGVCAEFQPLEGDPTLETFLDFLDAAEESEDPIPLAATTTSDSVKLMTVHGAKGLEFDTVFLPVLAAQQDINRYDGTRKGSVFPDVRLSDPLTSTTQLPPAVRRDAEFLPSYRESRSTWRRELKRRAEEDERRLFYVALTRARQRLYCTAAHWYGSEETPKGPSVFLLRADCDGRKAAPGVLDETDLVEILRLDERPAINPVTEAMRETLVWPTLTPRLPDETLGWIDRVEALCAGELRPEEVLTDGGHGAEEHYAEHVRMIDALIAARSAPGGREDSHRSLSATAAVRIAVGKESPQSVLYPLPQRPTEAQRLGIEVHAWIEERARRLTGLAQEDALDEASLAPDRELVRRLQAAYDEMGFDAKPLATLDGGEPASELPFTLKVGDVLVRGRIDAVYETEDGLQVVDFKTGRLPDEPDWGQLELYAEALTELGIARGEMTLTYAYLEAGQPISKRYTARGLGWLTDGLAAVGR